MSTTGSTPAALDALEEALAPILHLSSVGGLLRWDQQVMMPAGGTPARSKQLATVSGLRQELLRDEHIGRLLNELDAATLDGDEAAIVREARRLHERAVAVPTDLVEEIEETTATAHPVWDEAKEADDFASFAPHLEHIIELKRQYAYEIDPDRDPYAVLFEDYEPYLSLATAETVLTDLRDELVPLIDAIHATTSEVRTDAIPTPIDPEEQSSLSRLILDAFAYDWDRGRLDTSSHPFTSGNQFDARITTRFDADEPLSSLYSTIHEYGHAQYELGLPKAAYGSPLGQSRDLTVHESQSRFWENHVGRSPAFWAFLLGQDGLPATFTGIDAQAAFESASQVYPDNLIRVEADELTYHLHIIIRFEIERALICGDLAVGEVPTVWNDKYESYLGVRPETETDGCLQDIHWSSGLVGYFPTYSLGSVLAAQLEHAITDDLGPLEEYVRAGRFEPIATWLQEHVHQHGSRYETPELVEVATGEPYTATHFTDYVTEKYGTLYGV